MYFNDDDNGDVFVYNPLLVQNKFYMSHNTVMGIGSYINIIEYLSCLM
jgi:hypothetical protein